MSIKVLSELKVGTVREDIAAATKSGSNNQIHDIDFSASHANYTISAANAANNKITFSNTVVYYIVWKKGKNDKQSGKHII